MPLFCKRVCTFWVLKSAAEPLQMPIGSPPFLQSLASIRFHPFRFQYLLSSYLTSIICPSLSLHICPSALSLSSLANSGGPISALKGIDVPAPLRAQPLPPPVTLLGSPMSSETPDPSGMPGGHPGGRSA